MAHTSPLLNPGLLYALWLPAENGIDLDAVMKGVLHLARRHEVGGRVAGWALGMRFFTCWQQAGRQAGRQAGPAQNGQLLAGHS